MLISSYLVGCDICALTSLPGMQRGVRGRHYRSRGAKLRSCAWMTRKLHGTEHCVKAFGYLTEALGAMTERVESLSVSPASV